MGCGRRAKIDDRPACADSLSVISYIANFRTASTPKRRVRPTSPDAGADRRAASRFAISTHFDKREAERRGGDLRHRGEAARMEASDICVNRATEIIAWQSKSMKSRAHHHLPLADNVARAASGIWRGIKSDNHSKFLIAISVIVAAAKTARGGFAFSIELNRHFGITRVISAACDCAGLSVSP